MYSILWKKPPDKMLISRSDLHIWRISLCSISYPFKYLCDLLSFKERKYSKCFIFKRDLYRYQITHSMKRLILASYLSCDPKHLRFEINSHGKPRLDKFQNPIRIQFNISHSQNLILIAITIEDSIGIDIEYKNKKLPIENLGEIIFSPLESKFFAALTTQQEKEEVFFRCWTRKEAYLKAVGVGLIPNLTHISVDLNKTVNSQNWLKNLTLSQPEFISWKLFPLDIDNGYVANAVATSFQKNLFCYEAPAYLSN